MRPADSITRYISVGYRLHAPEDETASAVRTWGSQHAALWAGLIAGGRAVEVVLGRDSVRLAVAGRVLRQVGGDAARVRGDGSRGGRGGDGRDQERDRYGRRGRAGGVRRPEPRAATHARPQRRLRRKPPVHGRDHDGPDVALAAGAVRTARDAGKAARDYIRSAAPEG